MDNGLALVDPAVSREKFVREVEEYRRFENEYLRRGWFLLQATFPEVFVVFAATKAKPPALVFGAVLNFENYDFWPPSVRLVDPFTKQPYRANQLPTVLPRRRIVQQRVEKPDADPEAPPEIIQFAQDIPLMMSHSPEEIPFLCLPGVREYHDHPAHSGDSWLLHRHGGEGTLHFILDNLYKYGVDPITGFAVQMVPSIQFRQGDPPE